MCLSVGEGEKNVSSESGSEVVNPQSRRRANPSKDND